MSDEPEPITLRSVTVSEVMDSEGQLDIVIQTEGEPELWTVLGMLEVGLISVRSDLSVLWSGADET